MIRRKTTAIAAGLVILSILMLEYGSRPPHISAGANGTRPADQLSGSETDQPPNEAFLYDVRRYGAVADGTTNDTAAIQAVIDMARPNGIITGGGRRYAVSKLHLKSNISFCDFYLRTVPYDGTTGEFYSPVTIGAYNDIELRENIQIHNVHIDGARTYQTGIGATEDGGRHGFRIIGPVEDLWITNSSATYCASDGLCLYRGIGMGSIQTYHDGIKHRVHVVNSRFDYNRRHGASGDTMRNVTFVDCTFNNNGTEINGGVTEGDRGCESNEGKFGNGFDLEEYNETDWFGEIAFVGCQFVDNARAGILVYSGSGVKANAMNFVPRGPIRLVGCVANRGVHNWPTAYEFTPSASANDLGIYFRDVQLIGCISDAGLVRVRATDRAKIIGGTFHGTGRYDIELYQAARTWITDLPVGTRVHQEESTFVEDPPEATVKQGL